MSYHSYHVKKMNQHSYCTVQSIFVNIFLIRGLFTNARRLSRMRARIYCAQKSCGIAASACAFLAYTCAHQVENIYKDGLQSGSAIRGRASAKSKDQSAVIHFFFFFTFVVANPRLKPQPNKTSANSPIPRGQFNFGLIIYVWRSSGMSRMSGILILS